MKNTAAHVLIDTIAEWGVDVIFGMQGEPNRDQIALTGLADKVRELI